MKGIGRIWIPLTSVDGIAFGSSEDELRKSSKLKTIEREKVETVGWEVYGIDDRFRVYCEEGEVVSIAVYDSLILGDVNLIGLPFLEVVRLLKQEHFAREDPLIMSEGVETPVDFDGLGLVLWIKNDRVQSATCDDGR